VQPHPAFRAAILHPRVNVALLDLQGRVDIYAGPRLKELLFGAIAQGSRHIIVDLSKVTDLDSTGLGVLVAAAKRAGTASLAIVCSDQKLSGLLALVGLDRAFAICTSRTAALAGC
jgi:anti-sigma B factor antagonist